MLFGSPFKIPLRFPVLAFMQPGTACLADRLGGSEGFELAEGRCGNGCPGCPSSRIGPSRRPVVSNPTIGPEQGVGQSLRWAHLVGASCVHGREVSAHLEAAPADAVRALKLRRGEDRIVKSTEVMIAAQVKPASAVDFGSSLCSAVQESVVHGFEVPDAGSNRACGDV
jgi:hypothetical protein